MKYESLIRIATADINEEKLDNVRKSLVKLTDVELRRGFLEDGELPEDESLRFCPFCKCKNCVDVPNSNLEKIERNKAKVLKFQRDKAEWERQKESGENCVRTGVRGQECVERAPRCPKMEKIVIVCHCHQFRNPNPRRWDEPSSTCPIKCKDKDGNHYGWDDVKRRTKCPACICNCTAAFETLLR